MKIIFDMPTKTTEIEIDRLARLRSEIRETEARLELLLDERTARIRELSESGLSYRRISELAEISHQRVAQIVTAGR